VALSKSQIDRLGDRLKTGERDHADLVRGLEEYRSSFKLPYSSVLAAIRAKLDIEPIGRPVKTTQSITDKLRRESIRLSQMQDIAGCRLVVEDIPAQEDVLEQLRQVFPNARVIDRRLDPSFGYRAIHLVVQVEDRPIEFSSARDCNMNGLNSRKSCLIGSGQT
jgi:ppGpp synthetase/RelA/SpoT-type nucleotidyltranferase